MYQQTGTKCVIRLENRQTRVYNFKLQKTIASRTSKTRKEVHVMHIIDCHCHIYPDKIADKAVRGISAFYDLPMAGAGTADDYKRRCEKAGIDRSVVFSVATSVRQVRSINRFIKEIVDGSGGRFIGLGTLHPESPDIKDDIDDLLSLGLRGVKLHPDVQGFKTDDYRCLKIYEYCEKLGLPVLLHTGDFRYDLSNVNRLKPILDAYTGLTVIGAHFGGWSLWEDSSRELAGYPNLYVDSSSSLYALEPETARDIVRRYGADRVLFATDYPMWDPSEELERFDRLGLTEEEKEKILWKNAAGLWNIEL